MSDFRAIVLIGSTGSGKTALAHALFHELIKRGRKAELVNCDAFQFYQGLSIGTAKPTAEEIEKYHYHGIDTLKPSENIDAQRFANLAHKTCAEIAKRGAVPICLGGSGLYLRALLHGLDDLPGRDEELRKFFRASAGIFSWPTLHMWLNDFDDTRAAQLHPNDGTRIERALELFFLTKKRPCENASKRNMLKEQELRFPALILKTECSEEKLKARIEKRTKEMFAAGWLDEVQTLMRVYPNEALELLPAFQAIGYREILQYLKKPTSTQAFRELEIQIQNKTWQYAKRQRTWNAKEHCDHVIHTEEMTTSSASFSLELFEKIISFIK